MTKGTEKFLVTGAAGCIGAWAIRLLLDDGVDVVASDVSEDLRRFHLISHPRRDVVDFVPLDVTDTAAVARVVEEHQITHIVHLAGLQVPFCAANPPLGAMVNVVGNVNFFDAVRASGRSIGLAYASSAAVFGGGSAYSGGVVGDTSPLLPDTHYGVYKVANEGTARIYSLNNGIGSVGLRPFIVYGPGRDQGMTSDATKALNILYSRRLADAWISLPNTNSMFRGHTPLAYMLRLGQPGMMHVRQLLDARRGGQ